MCDVISHESIKAEEALECHELLMWVILVVHAAPVHHALSVEQLQIGSDEYAIFLESARANLLTILRVMRYLTVDAFFLKHTGQLRQVLVDDETVRLPMTGAKIVVCDQRRVVGLALATIRVAVVLLLGRCLLMMLITVTSTLRSVSATIPILALATSRMPVTSSLHVHTLLVELLTFLVFAGIVLIVGEQAWT